MQADSLLSEPPWNLPLKVQIDGSQIKTNYKIFHEREHKSQIK